MNEDFLFQSAHAALVFAFNFSSQQYDRPLMNRVAAPAIGSGKGLAGLDGAAQAGMIRAEVRGLGRLNEAALIARFAPRFELCECRSACCSGKKLNKEWVAAISVLSDHARTTALAGCSTDGMQRRAYVVRYFTAKDSRDSLESLAQKHSINRDTASAHYSRVAGLFAGRRGKGGLATAGIEDIARLAADDKFRAIGLIE